MKDDAQASVWAGLPPWVPVGSWPPPPERSAEKNTSSASSASASSASASSASAPSASGNNTRWPKEKWASFRHLSKTEKKQLKKEGVRR